MIKTYWLLTEPNKYADTSYITKLNLIGSLANGTISNIMKGNDFWKKYECYFLEQNSYTDKDILCMALSGTAIRFELDMDLLNQNFIYSIQNKSYL